MGFLDQINSVLSDGLSGQTDYGAAPSATSMNSPTAQVLARIKPPEMAQQQSYPGPAPTGLLASLTGLSAVDPRASKFGAFAQGLAGGLAAQGNANLTNAQFGLRQQQTALENFKNALGIGQQLRQQNALDAVGRLGTGSPDAYPGGYTGPGAGGGAPTLAPSPNGGADMSPYQNAISTVESGGRYDAQGPVTKTGDRAYGRYQVMGANIPSWTKEILGTEMTPEQFLGDPKAQDAVFNGKFGAYLRQTGSPSDAASMWFTGKPMAQGAGARDQLGTSGADYVGKFTAALPPGATAYAASGPAQGGPAPFMPPGSVSPRQPGVGAPPLGAPPAASPQAGGPPTSATQPLPTMPQGAVAAADPSGANAPTPEPRTVSPAIAGSKNFWMRVPPENNPYFLRWRAGINDQRALVPGLPADMSNSFARQAQQDRQSAATIESSNMVGLRDGTRVLIPGSLYAEATMAAAKAAAQKHAENEQAFQAAGGVTPTGTHYLPNPDVPAVPTAARGGAAGPQAAAPAPGASQGTAPPAPAPTAAIIDPETAAVQTAIPKAPAGGGYPLPADLPAGAKMTELSPAGKAVAEADKPFYEAMGNAPAIDQTIEKFQSMGQAFKLFESGSLAEKRQAGATLAAALGAPDIAARIQAGDPAAYQWVEKEGAPLAMNQLKAVTQKFTQAEFKTTYGTSVPSPDKMPQANHQMIAEGLAQAQAAKQFNSDWQTAQSQGWSSPSAFYQAWVKANPPAAFIRSAQRQLGNFKGMATPSPDQWAAGVSYVYNPKGMTPQQQQIFQKDGVKPGAMFRFNGRGAQQAISPVDTSGGKGFSSYLGDGQ